MEGLTTGRIFMEDLSVGTVVASAGFAAGILFGATANRTDFCAMGSLSDIVFMGDFRLKGQLTDAQGSRYVKPGLEIGPSTPFGGRRSIRSTGADDRRGIARSTQGGPGRRPGRGQGRNVSRRCQKTWFSDNLPAKAERRCRGAAEAQGDDRCVTPSWRWPRRPPTAP